MVKKGFNNDGNYRRQVRKVFSVHCCNKQVTLSDISPLGELTEIAHHLGLSDMRREPLLCVLKSFLFSFVTRDITKTDMRRHDLAGKKVREVVDVADASSLGAIEISTVRSQKTLWLKLLKRLCFCVNNQNYLHVTHTITPTTTSSSSLPFHLFHHLIVIIVIAVVIIATSTHKSHLTVFPLTSTSKLSILAAASCPMMV